MPTNPRGLLRGGAIFAMASLAFAAQHSNRALRPTPRRRMHRRDGRRSRRSSSTRPSAPRTSPKIPLSVTVISGDDLEDQHIVTFADLTRAVPNLSFSGGAQGGGSGLANIELRGISSQAGSATVGIYLDEVSLSIRNLYSLGSAEPRFFDLAQIEVLRGPQGTLYGASSMGGTIKFVGNQPNLRATESAFSAELSSTEHGGTNGNRHRRV